MILYFTGTGNSKFAAEYLAEHIGDDLVSLNDVLKHKLPLRFNSARPFVIVAPIYAWGFPRIIEKLIRKAEFTGSEQIYFIGTMGSQTGDADRALENIAYDKEMAYMGFCGVTMPNNFILGGNIPDAVQSERIIRASLPLLHELSDRIMSGTMIEKCDRTPLSFLVSGVVNDMFNRHFITSKNFTVSDRCIECGQCQELCPVNNIRIVEGKPVFNKYCLNCYSCINRCPAEAINIGKRTETINRYVCPEYSEFFD